MSSSKKTTTTQWTDPYKPAAPGIQAAAGLATEGIQNAQEYQGRFSPQTSPWTQGGVDALKGVFGALPAGYGSEALPTGSYLANKIFSGGYRPPTYDPAAAIESAVRPVTEKYSENLLPNLGAFFTSSGGYQGGHQGGTSNTAGEVLARNYQREALQVGGEQALAAANLNSQNMIQGNQQELNAIGGLPAVLAQALQAAGLPAGLQAQIGAGEEALAGRDIMEALNSNQYHNLYEAGIAGPYTDILMGPAQAFGTTTNITKQKLDPVTQALGAIVAGASAAMGNPAGVAGGAQMAAGGATGVPGNPLDPARVAPGSYSAAPAYSYMNPFGGGSNNMPPWILY